MQKAVIVKFKQSSCNFVQEARSETLIKSKQNYILNNCEIKLGILNNFNISINISKNLKYTLPTKIKEKNIYKYIKHLN